MLLSPDFQPGNVIDTQAINRTIELTNSQCCQSQTVPCNTFHTSPFQARARQAKSGLGPSGIFIAARFSSRGNLDLAEICSKLHKETLPSLEFSYYDELLMTWKGFAGCRTRSSLTLRYFQPHIIQ